jgi:glycosyltransferase involved in cell wall biosynthesis
MHQEPLVSVVMTVLDPDPRYFREAVASVLAQDYANLELVIVEDPSPRSAGEMLSVFDDARIRHVANSDRTSHSRQRNQSLSLARGELVATLDADDICEPTRISRQIRFLTEHPEVDVVGTQLCIIDADGRKIGSRAYPTTHETIVAAMPRFNPIAQPSAMFRKSTIVAAGGYRYDRFPAVEDYELWSRLATGGVKFANLPEPLLRYRLHSGGMKATRLKGILRGTIDVKQRYWLSQLGLRGHLRMALEQLLLFVPPALTYQLFSWTILRRVKAEK